MPVINWVCLPISCGLYLPSTGYYLPTRRGLYLSPTEYTYLPDVGYTCHQLGIPTYQTWAIPVINWVLPTYQTWAIPVISWVYLPTRRGLYLLPTGYTYLPDVGYTCHQLGIPTFQSCGIHFTNWIYSIPPTRPTYQMHRHQHRSRWPGNTPLWRQHRNEPWSLAGNLKKRNVPSHRQILPP